MYRLYERQNRDNIFHLVVRVQMFINENTKVFDVLNQFNVLIFSCKNTILEISALLGACTTLLVLNRNQYDPKNSSLIEGRQAWRKYFTKSSGFYTHSVVAIIVSHWEAG